MTNNSTRNPLINILIHYYFQDGEKVPITIGVTHKKAKNLKKNSFCNSEKHL